MRRTMNSHWTGSAFEERLTAERKAEMRRERADSLRRSIAHLTEKIAQYKQFLKEIEAA